MYKLSDFGVERKTATLSNSVNLSHYQRKGIPLYLKFNFLSGSRFNPPGKQGLAHFTEHMILDGTEKYPTKDKWVQQIERLGSIAGASTSSSVLDVWCELGSQRDLSEIIEVVSQFLIHPIFDSDSIEKERGAILSELGEKETNASKYIWDVAARVLYQNSPLAQANLGTRETINSITREDIVNYYKNMIIAGRLAITTSGDVEFDKLIAQLESGLLLQKTSRFDLPKPIPTLRDKFIEIFPNSSDQIELVLSFRTCEMFDPDEIPLRILSSVIGVGRTSRLNVRLRQERGLVYGVGTISNSSLGYGSWSVDTSVNKKNLGESLKIITEELDRARQGKLFTEEIEHVKSRILNGSLRSMQTSASWANFHYFDDLVNPELNYTYDNYLNDISSVTLDQVSKVANKYFKPNSWYFAACGDIEEKDIKIDF